MIRSLLLGAALSSLMPLAAASEGMLRFNGRIVEAGCNVDLVHQQQQLNLGTCPLSALGAQVQVTTLDTGDIVAMTAYRPEQGLAALAHAPLGRVFSHSYALRAPGNHRSGSGYLVVVDYP